MTWDFYIFRHGETNWNKERRIQGHTNTSLNAVGSMQAETLIPILMDKKIEVIYSSDLDRAMETAKIVNKNLNLEIKPTEKLREAHFGEAEGLLLDEIIGKWGQELWDNFRKLDRSFYGIGFPGGETRGASVQRMRSVIDEIMNYTPYKKIAISTHGGVVRNLLHSFLPDDHEPLPIHNCVCYHLRYDSQEEVWSVMGPLNSGEDYF